MQIGGVLLAAGGGSRFAGPSHKLVSEVGGKPIISHAIEHMVASGVRPLLIVTGAAEVAHLIPGDCQVMHNPRWEDGQAGSLQIAVGWARERALDGIVVGLADQPGIPAEAWAAVAAAPPSPIAVATYGGRRGNPVRLEASVWPLLPVTGDEGARVVMAGSPALVLEVACDGDPGDVDTVEDLARWR